MTPLLYLAFFLSGVAGLVYETLWARYLGLFVGHGAYAQVIVLVVFLGGLALGSLLVGARAERVRSPLLWYAGVELAVGAVGVAFHPVFTGTVGVVQGAIFPALAGSALLLPVKWLVAGALLLPPAVLMGTTFPLMSAGILRARAEGPGRILGMLYFVNSLGAAAGALLGGFVLVPSLGLPGALGGAALLNAVAGLLAVAGALRWREGGASRPFAAAPAPGSVPDPWILLLVVSFATAVASFIYEIAWIRMLSLVLGAATHSFEIMLSAFIAGLAFGALFVQRWADRWTHPLRALAVIQWLMGLAALATLPLYVHLFDATAALLPHLTRDAEGYRIFNLARYGMAMAVMVPSTFFAGMTLPLITRTLVLGPRGERAIGWVYGVNTMGSIAGVALASLLLLPLVGLKALLVIGASLDMLIGVALLARWGRGAGKGGAPAARLLAGTAAAVALIAAATPFDGRVLLSGVFRHGGSFLSGEILFWKDGRTATVGVRDASGDRIISTNGKPDASISAAWLRGEADGELRAYQRDEATQTLAALVPLAHVPSARSAVVVGQGSGMTSHHILASAALEELVTVEIEPAMIEGSRLFLPANRRVFEDPRARFVVDDAKSFFAAGRRRFDLVVSEPSNPWVSGVASLFTREFYALAASQLAPGGIFGQWIHVYESRDALVLSVLRALHESFASYAVYRVHSGDLMIVASNEDRLPEPDWGILDWPGVAEDLRGLRPLGAGYLERSLFLTREALAPLLDVWSVANSDFHPVLEVGSELARFEGQAALGFVGAGGSDFDPSDVFLPPLTSLDLPGPNPIPALPALAAADLNHRYRLLAASGDTASAFADDPEGYLRNAWWHELRLEELAARAERGTPPDWEVWGASVRDAIARRHGGLRGWADDAFFDAVEATAATGGAPRPVRTALRFHRAAAGWRWAEAADAAVELGAEEPSAWLPLVGPDLLRDTGVTALLREGRTADARRLYDGLAPLSTRDARDLRSRLLLAYLRAAETGGGA